MIIQEQEVIVFHLSWMRLCSTLAGGAMWYVGNIIYYCCCAQGAQLRSFIYTPYGVSSGLFPSIVNPPLFAPLYLERDLKHPVFLSVLVGKAHPKLPAFHCYYPKKITCRVSYNASNYYFSVRYFLFILCTITGWYIWAIEHAGGPGQGVENTDEFYPWAFFVSLLVLRVLRC